MPALTGRRTFARVDLGAIAHNVKVMAQSLSEGTSLTAVVKADAYGHGIVPVSRTALSSGATMLAVAMAEEALPLREAGIEAPILIIGPSNADQLALGVKLGLDICVFASTQLRILERCATASGRQVPIHLKVDTGMGRIGIAQDGELNHFLETLSECPHLRLEGMFTHFACADSYSDQSTTHRQHQKFLHFADIVRARGHLPKLHVSNSAASQDLPDFDHDAVRFGISLYGYPPSPQTAHRAIELRPAMQVYAEISWVKTVDAGTPIGYGGTFVAPTTMRIATVQIGYGDGYNRLLSNRGHMIVRTADGPRLARIVGRVCMDMTMIDVTGFEGVQPGDLVVAMGEEGAVRFDADAIADLCGTISYEVLLDYTSRLPRLYEEYHG